MQDKTRYLRWCFRQERGIRLVKPSENLVKAYLQKSKNSLKSMDVNAKAEIIEWAVSAGYYSKYFATYALISKIGLKCEIHDCTIALFEYLFRDSLPLNILRQLRESKEDRIETQYYPYPATINLDEMMDRARGFVLEIENLIDGLNSEKIAALQNRLRELASSSRRPA